MGRFNRFKMRRLAWLFNAVAIEDWDENVVPACYYKLIGPMHRSLYVYLFFDTETTGVNKSSDRVIQLAWILATESGKELRRQNLLIKPSGFEIPTAAEKIHGISTAVASRFGVPLRHALLEFANDVENCQVLVAHNLSFDLGMLRPEFGREEIRWRLDEKSMICTMRISTNWCRLSKLDGRPGYKWPKLEELHYRLFGRYFENAHDALNDVVATKDCFFELNRRKILVDPLADAREQGGQRSLKNSSELKPRKKIKPLGATDNKTEPSKKTKSEKLSKSISESSKSLPSRSTQRNQPKFGIADKSKPFRTVLSVSLKCDACGESFSVTLRRYERSASCPNCFAAVSSEVHW